MTLIRDAITYVKEITGLQVAARPVHPKNLPVFITEQYDFYTLTLGNEKFLAVELKEEISPSALEKHRAQFPIHDSAGLVLISSRLESFARRRLIEMKTPFVVPHVQLYWPALGIEFRKRNQHAIVREAQAFSPATQAVVIGILTDLFPPTFQPKDLAEKLGYTRMSMTRATDDLEYAGLGTSTKKGLHRIFMPLERSVLWEKALPYLIDPVRDVARLYTRDVPRDERLLAGESALAQISMLAEPRTPTYAVWREGWNKLASKAIPSLNTEEPDTCAVQVWRYDPSLFARDGTVDRFSLYLSLKDSPDERVMMALTQTIKQYL